MKEKYKDLYQKHQIHTIDNKNRIVLTEAKVDDFAMKLKISRDIPPKGSFRDETRRYFEHLKGFAGDDIEICQLIEEDSRVTFIRGIAGMGKSVLAKQLTYGWAKGALYTDFKLCIMVECRDLNYFQATKGVDLKTHEIFEEFLKTKFNHDLKDGEGVLFVVDGMDELYDINTSDSTIRQLINRNISKYSRSKIIITGRPHVEDKLEAYDNEIGGLRKLEILGLSDEQINDYIRKFPSYHHNISFINKAKESSRGHLSVLHVPQFLNTFCCIAILMEGEKIWSPTELYCWTIYFLLKQHGDKLSSSKSRRSNKLPQIFKEYSGSLLTLSKICDELLNENKIILEGKIESMVDGTGKGKSFIESLFVDISDELHEKYQFKHLSIMEFLAALHICNTKNRIEIIKNKLDKGWIETVSFVCRLISGFSSTGIVKEMLINVTKLRSINANKFLKNVLELLCRSSLNDKVKVKRSLEIIVCFLNKSFRKKSLLTSIIAKLHHSDFESNEIDTSNIMKICNHLVDVCGCKEQEIRGAFKNIQFHWLIVDSISDLSCVKYFESVGLIELRNNRMDSIAIRRQFDRKLFGNCKLGIVDCEFKDEEYYKGERQADGKLERLRINSCKLGINSFRNLCHSGMLSGVFQLLDLNIEDKWWKDLVDMIEENHNCGDFELKELEINRCATEMTAEMKEKVRILARYLFIILMKTMISLNVVIADFIDIAI